MDKKHIRGDSFIHTHDEMTDMAESIKYMGRSIQTINRCAPGALSKRDEKGPLDQAEAYYLS